MLHLIHRKSILIETISLNCVIYLHFMKKAIIAFTLYPIFKGKMRDHFISVSK